MRLQLKHRFPTRMYHWVNAATLPVMLWSGLLIYWANDVYRVDVFGATVFKFFPDWFYSNRLFRLDHRLSEGMGWHFLFMWFFAANGICYVAYTLASGEWRDLVPDRRTPLEAWHVVLHDMGLRKAPLPPGKFNAAQRVAYTGVVLMGFGSLLTGLAIYKPVQAGLLTAALGGYEAARAEHFALTIGYVFFFIVHIAQVVRAGWNNFRSMVIGVEVLPGPAPGSIPHPVAVAPPEADHGPTAP